MRGRKINLLYIFTCMCASITRSITEDILGCGGFLKSHADIDFSKVHIKLYTKAGSLKDQTECAPNSGYYFLPLYDKGEYVLKVDPPRGWSFEPMEVPLNVDGFSDICSQGKDINFTFKGFGITGRAISFGSDSGPKGLNISLYAEDNNKTAVDTTTTAEGGIFYFTPVQPGKYMLVASHPTWLLKENTVEVVVQEGNKELEDGSLVILGYDVSGQVTSKDEPVSGVSFLLFGNGTASKDCIISTTKASDFPKPLCHVISDNKGRFTFPALSTGHYKIIPYYADYETKFEVEPDHLEFDVEHNSLVLSENFKVTGFTATGIVRMSKDGDPLEKANIFLSGKKVAVTDKNGRYVLKNIKTGQYTLQAKAEDVQFNERPVKVSPNASELPPLIPSAYKVCGKVSLSAKDTLHHRKVTVQNIATTIQREIDTDPKTGEFCLYLSPDTYQLNVLVNPEEKTKGLQFFPLQQTIDVTSHSLSGINFLQLKATLIGTVQCLPATDCSQASVTLKILDGVTIKTVQSKDGQYRFSDVLPGHYEVLIDNDIFCWETPSYQISITSEHAEVPPFKQTGFSVTFISSHSTDVVFSDPSDSKKATLALTKGSTRHCVSKSGQYTFTPKGCHQFDKSTYTWDTENVSPIILSSTEHTHKGSIVTSSPVDPIEVKIESPGYSSTIVGPLEHTKMKEAYKYEYEFKAKTDNIYIITPLSDILLFDPPSLKVLGVNDCHDDIPAFAAELGKIITGKTSPPLEGVTIQIFGKNKEYPIHTLVTEKDGTYSIGPLDGKIDYSVTAEKEGFVISGPDVDGVFTAHKLAEIIVQAFDRMDNIPLQGVLLSLSGGQSYRKNSMTNEDGKVIFNSLSPGEYYLRPMMKEYIFDPPSKMIDVKEGVTVNVSLSGNRVAFSAYGSVTSLNGEPEPGLVVEVQGQRNCSNLQEEATTEENGNFRIRGLRPTCVYAFRLKQNVDANAHIHRTSPSSLLIQTTEDVHGLRLIAFHPISRMDVSVHVISAQAEYYRTLKVKLCREDMLEYPLHILKLDTPYSNKIGTSYNAGFLLHFPPLQADGKKYLVQLESSLSPTSHKYRTIPIYFEANTSFKYIKLLFNAERKIDQGDMNQTSVVALPFIMLVAFAFFNRDKLWSWLNTVVERWSKPAPSARAPVQALPIDPRADDIIVEQIMNINKRKMKPRKA